MAKKKTNAQKKHQQKMKAKALENAYSAKEKQPESEPAKAEPVKEKGKEAVKAVKPKSAKQTAIQTKQKKERQRKTISDYFRGVKLEMRKVVWPTRKELGSYTIVVLCTCAAFALLFWGVDSGVLAGIKALCF